MPSMMEIYERHADRYDELVRAEDFRGNLASALDGAAEWPGAAVLEAGVGTGRVTRLYASEVARATCLDGSRHMVDFAQNALAEYAGKLTFGVADNLALPDYSHAFDIFVEAWAFGHSVVDAPDCATVAATTETLLTGVASSIRAGGTVLIMETLGTNVNKPAAPTETLAWFYEELEKTHGFDRHEVSTDYAFPSVEEAERVMGFFFGEEMGVAVRERGSATVPEWTGLWVRHG